MDRKSRITAVIWACVCFAALITYMTVARNYLDSDMASEMILAKMCAHDNVIMHKNWYYSTEIRLMNMNLPMTLFFHFFNNFRLVRILSSIVMIGSVSLGFLYCAKQAGLKNSAIYFVSILVLPFSGVFFRWGLTGLHYCAYNMAVFFSIGLFFRINNKGLSAKKKIVLWILYILFALLMGLTTIRQVLVLYYPFTLACLILWLMDYVETYGLRVITVSEIKEHIVKDRRKNQYLCYFLTSCVGAAVCSLAYVLNVVVLRRIYDFNSFDRVLYTNVDNFEKFSEAVIGHLRVFGYEPGVQFLSLQGICNLLVIIFTVFLIILTYRMIKKNRKFEIRQRVVLIYFACAVLFNDFIYIFSDLCGDRYMLPYILCFLLVLCIFVERKDIHISVRRLVYVLVMGLFLVNSLCRYTEAVKAEHDTGRQEAVEFLMEQDYDFGYATYWNANIITELTEGQIEMRNVNDTDFTTMHCNPWLIRKDLSYYYSDHTVFILITDEEYLENSGLEMFYDYYKVYDNKGYKIYEYWNSYELWNMVEKE